MTVVGLGLVGWDRVAGAGTWEGERPTVESSESWTLTFVGFSLSDVTFGGMLKHVSSASKY
eukprot:5512539-Prymnesium_polylepis.1